MGFWKNFVDTFSMQGYDVYIAAESYGGMYGPYISSHFVNAKDTKYYNLKGLMVVDGISFDSDVQSEVIVESFVAQNYVLMPFDDMTMAAIHNVSEQCGYRDYLKKYYAYPPAGPQPSSTPWTHKLANGTVVYKDGCGNLWDFVFRKALSNNPSFNIYNLLNFSPAPVYDPLGDKPYFNREDVKKALHAPLDIQWGECVDTPFVQYKDMSAPPSLRELPNVIDKTKNVMYVQGGMDFILPPSGVLLGIQNMTWGNKMGFQSRPSAPFYVPRYGYDFNGNKFYGSTFAEKSGVLGTTHEERGLTVVVTVQAGHEGPEFAGAASIRQLEKLLGRVKSLSDTEPFTFPQLRNIPQDKKPLGKGTYPIPFLGTAPCE